MVWILSIRFVDDKYSSVFFADGIRTIYNKLYRDDNKGQKNTIKIIFGFVGNILCTCTWGYIIGALGSNNPVADKYGFFSLNLNALINPLSQGYDSWSIFFPVLPQILGNYDGFNYLGAGIIVALSGIIVLAITKRKNYNKVLFRIKNNFLLLIGCLFFTVFSVTNVVTLNDKIIIEYI